MGDVPPVVPATPRPGAAAAEWRASRSAEELEATIGSRWMLVVGTVILVLGVAFFVKYAFDSDWINETARVAAGTVAGLLLWGVGLRLVGAGYQPYGRVIAGGGLAIVYIAAYAAHALYDLVPAGVAFTWMAAVSAATATTADRQRSAGLALTAIVLAYFAPLLVGRDGGHLAFFAYILALGAVTGLLTRRHDWPALGLSALYLTVATTVMWFAQSFSSDVYVSTEVYLTAALVLFVIILRTDRSSRHPLARVCRGVRLALPVLYHGASLIVLYPHSVPYLGYLILGTAVTAAIPAIRDSPRVRLGVWAGVSAPFYAWLIKIPILTDHFSTLAPNYDAVLSDVWGVVHNGVAATPPACEALTRFREQGRQRGADLQRAAPRRAGVIKFLDHLKVPRSVYDAIVTSGDVTRDVVAQARRAERLPDRAGARSHDLHRARRAVQHARGGRLCRLHRPVQ